MKNFMDDLRTAARTFNLAQKARKQGAVLKVQEAINLPVSDFEGWGATMEATLLKGKANQAVCKVFNELSPKARHDLLFTPKNPGEWLARAQFWRGQLKPALPHAMYYESMIRLCSWYRHCIIRGKEKT